LGWSRTRPPTGTIASVSSVLGWTTSALVCADRSELEKWQRRLDELGIEHGVIAEDAAGFALPFRDPDNIALELWAPRP
jgi:glyoxylase I family protein